MLDVLNRSRARPLVALLLAVLFAHAIPSQPISLDRGRGPVFSAATAEVTLPPREDNSGIVCTVTQPCPDKTAPFTNILTPKASLHAGLQQKPWPAHGPRAPPLKPPPRSLASPREPPRLI